MAADARQPVTEIRRSFANPLGRERLKSVFRSLLRDSVEDLRGWQVEVDWQDEADAAFRIWRENVVVHGSARVEEETIELLVLLPGALAILKKRILRTLDSGIPEMLARAAADDR